VIVKWFCKFCGIRVEQWHLKYITKTVNDDNLNANAMSDVLAQLLNEAEEPQAYNAMYEYQPLSINIHTGTRKTTNACGSDGRS